MPLGRVRAPSHRARPSRASAHARQAEGLAPEGDVTLYQYHPPFTYGWQRVNEVLFRVAGAGAGAGAAGGGGSAKKAT